MIGLFFFKISEYLQKLPYSYYTPIVVCYLIKGLLFINKIYFLFFILLILFCLFSISILSELFFFNILFNNFQIRNVLASSTSNEHNKLKKKNEIILFLEKYDEIKINKQTL